MFAQVFSRYKTGLTTPNDALCATKPETGLKDLTMFLEMMTRQVDILRREFDEKLIFDEIKTFHFNIRIVKARMR